MDATAAEHAEWDSTTRTAVYFGIYERAGLIRVARITRVADRQTDSAETGRTFPASKAGERAATRWMAEVNCRRVVRR